MIVRRAFTFIPRERGIVLGQVSRVSTSTCRGSAPTSQVAAGGRRGLVNGVSSSTCQSQAHTPACRGREEAGYGQLGLDIHMSRPCSHFCITWPGGGGVRSIGSRLPHVEAVRLQHHDAAGWGRGLVNRVGGQSPVAVVLAGHITGIEDDSLLVYPRIRSGSLGSGGSRQRTHL